MNVTSFGRTNYFPLLPESEAAFRKRMADFGLEVVENGDGVALIGSEEWPPSMLDENDNDVTFSLEQDVMPHVPDGHVVIAFSNCQEGMRSVGGDSEACINDEGETHSVSICLDSIYALASKEFEIPVEQIKRAYS
jgi:hypothetical protein